MGFLAMPDMVQAAIVTGRLALLEFFLASGSSAPMSIEMWHSRLNHGNSGGTKCTGHQLPLPQEL